MKFKPATLTSVHKQMAFVKAQSYRDLFTNYFRQAKRLYFFASDLAVPRLNRRA